MASAGRPRGFGSDPPTRSGRARGSPHLESYWGIFIEQYFPQLGHLYALLLFLCDDFYLLDRLVYYALFVHLSH